MAEVIRKAVMISTVGVRKCRLRMSAPHTLLKWLVHFPNRTFPVQGATGLPACLQNLWHRMCTESKAEVIQEAVLICTADVRKCRLRMSAPHRLEMWLVRFKYHTPKVKGVAVLPRMCIEPMAQDVCRAYG